MEKGRQVVGVTKRNDGGGLSLLRLILRPLALYPKGIGYSLVLPPYSWLFGCVRGWLWLVIRVRAGCGNLCAAMFNLCGLQVNGNGTNVRNRHLEDASTWPQKWTGCFLCDDRQPRVQK